jgi:uncharacterized integral membrane protein (TIGR00698 family)
VEPPKNKDLARRVAFAAAGALALTPYVSAPVALLAGLAFGLLWGNPFPEQSRQAQTWSLQAAVVAMGAGMNLGVVARVGVAGLGQTALTLFGTLLVALLLARLLSTERTTSLLIGVGTAVCGGSAIAAVAPAVGAKSQHTSVSLMVVFLLNAVALFVFPLVGHAAGLGPLDFGLWSALAIHDTSSVVGAALQFGKESAALATTVKLARALWIIPLTLVLARLWKHPPQGGDAKPRRPWFILGFVAAAALATWVPAVHAIGGHLAAVGRQLLVASLFLVGAQVSREALKAVGPRPLVLGVVLWVAVAGATLAALKLGLLHAPALG